MSYELQILLLQSTALPVLRRLGVPSARSPTPRLYSDADNAFPSRRTNVFETIVQSLMNGSTYKRPLRLK